MQRPSPMPSRTAVVVVLLVPMIAASFALVRSTAEASLLGTHLVAGLSGVVGACFYWHRDRGLGFLSLFTSLAAVCGLYALAAKWCPITVGAASFLLGFAFVRALLYLNRFHRDSAVLLLALVLAMIGFLAASNIKPLRKVQPPPISVAWFAGASIVTALLGWIFLFRPAVELCSEPVLWLLYRVRARGTGLKEVPVRGPCLVVANHACWFDPFFLAKVLPRPITPMMTSRFYDLPVARWLLRNVFPTIRVPEKALKKDVPDEIIEAIAALDRGECVVMFPEGMLRRSEEKALKRFGRGVWQILSARPETPVVCCWIEGNWGSYASYCNGPPTKNKRPDLRRPIGVAVESPIVIDPGLSKSHLATRLELMNRVAAARRHLGLPELPRFELPSLSEEDDGVHHRGTENTEGTEKADKEC